MAEAEQSGRTALSLKYKLLGYIAAWLIALFATDPSGGLWSLAWMFPLGLAAVASRHAANDGGWGVFGACVGVYLVHAIFYFRSRTSRATAAAFLLLVALLVGNVAGCRGMIHP